VTPLEKKAKRDSLLNVYKARKERKKDITEKTLTPPKEEKVPAQKTEEKKVSKPAKPADLVKQLEQQYGTKNIIELFEMEYRAGHLETALDLFNRMTPAQAEKPRSKIYKLRILRKLKRNKELCDFLDGNLVNDGEFVLAKGQLAYKRDQVVKAKILLNKALNIPINYSDYNNIKQQVYYYKALCGSKLFYSKPNERNYLKALEEWRDLGALFSNNKDHSYYKRYREEIRKIGEKYRTIEGEL
jgi:tetratricopeptide (TPR) repeat protein